MLLSHALAFSVSQFVHKKKSPRTYASMHSGGFELTKLTYTRLEDNLMRHRGDRVYKLKYLDLDPLGGLAQHILPPLSPSQPEIAEKKISCWGKEPSRSSLPSLLSLVSFLLSSHSLIFTACSKYALIFLFCFFSNFFLVLLLLKLANCWLLRGNCR